MNKIISVLLSLVMLMSLMSVGVAVSAATPDSQTVEAYAGETIKVKFVEDNCYGVSGSISYSNRALFSSLTPGGTTSYGKITDNKFILSSFDKVTCEVVLTVKIAADAQVGDQCVVSFYDCELVENNEDFSGRSGYTKTVTVKVVKKETTTKKPTTATTKKPTTATTKKPTTATTKKPTTATTKKPTTSVTAKPTTSVTTKPVVTTKPGAVVTTKPGASVTKKPVASVTKKPVASVIKKPVASATKKPVASATKKPVASATKKPISSVTEIPDDTPDTPAVATTTKPVPNLDTTELNKQISIADVLSETDYTVETWAQLVSALKAANNALGSGSQSEINKAVDALKEAIASLAPIDSTALEELIGNVDDFLTENDLTSVWDEVVDAMGAAEAALKIGDQEAINAAYTRLNAALQAMKDKLAEMDEDKVIIQDGDNSDECAEKCHIWKNTIWHPLLIILLIISVVLNLAMGALIAYYFIKRKQNAADNTPVVDYDINDD